MKKIIVPVDFTLSSAAALKFGARLCKLTQFQLSVVYISNSLIASNRPHREHDTQKDLSVLQRQLESFVDKHLPLAAAFDPAPEIIAAEGIPPAYLTLRSLEEDTALIVMGGLESRLGPDITAFGSIARAVWRGGGCPVIIIPRNFTDGMMRRNADVWLGLQTFATVEA